MLYHNQTAELRELLEFAHMYLQSDDEVSGPCPPGLGGDGDTLFFFLGPLYQKSAQLLAVSGCEAGEIRLSFIHTCLLSLLSAPLLSLMPPSLYV